MFEMIANEIEIILSTPRLLIANCFSLAATLSLIISCVVSERKKMFLFQAGQCALLCVTQAILGMYGGIVTTSLGALRDTANAFDKMNPRRAILMASVIGLAGTALNFIGGKPWYGLLPVVAAVIYSLGCQLFRKPNLLRVNLMVNLTFWVVYSFIIKDYITALTNGVTAVVALLAFIVIFVQEERGRRGIVIGRKEK
ncbi:MAG: YgjV family protein [Clostridia bacterium]|nr:YgjV family protein [Clostridia bacterium]